MSQELSEPSLRLQAALTLSTSIKTSTAKTVSKKARTKTGALSREMACVVVVVVVVVVGWRVSLWRV